jgi:drug/metabolite transporter (DMT)-like permease
MGLDGAVAFGLLAAVVWGSADFGGGLLGRHAPVFGVVLIGLLAGTAAAAGIALARGEPFPAGPDLAWSVAAGTAGAIGYTSLYVGLASGSMTVVAPVAGVLSAAVPVVVGLLTQGAPGPLVAVGIALAIAAVVMVSTSAGGSIAGLLASGFGLAVLAGLGLGSFGALAAQITDGLVFGPLVVIRLTELALVAAAVLASRRPVAMPRRLAAAAAVVGLLDMAGNASFILAAQSGRLDVAAVLSSLYPVATLVLAAVVLRERPTRLHAVGIVCAIVAIVLIAAG